MLLLLIAWLEKFGRCCASVANPSALPESFQGLHIHWLYSTKQPNHANWLYSTEQPNHANWLYSTEQPNHAHWLNSLHKQDTCCDCQLWTSLVLNMYWECTGNSAYRSSSWWNTGPCENEACVLCHNHSIFTEHDVTRFSHYWILTCWHSYFRWHSIQVPEISECSRTPECLCDSVWH